MRSHQSGKDSSVGYLHYDILRVKKNDQELHFDHNLHTVSDWLIIREVQFLIVYECLDYSSYNISVFNSDIQLKCYTGERNILY